MQELAGKVAVVTGAGSGIGLALARRLSAEGMRVALADVEPNRLAEAALGLVDAGADPLHVLVQPTDVRLADEVDALADRVFAEWGQVDLLANNAGVFVGGFLWERPAADLEWVLGVNLWGILHGIRAFVPRMIAQDTEGHVVDTCSIAGLLGTPYAGPYGISKFAALAATEALAADLALVGSKVKVTALCPGMVATDIAVGSEGHRPAELATDPTEDQAFVNEVLVEVTAQGIDPAEVAGMVVDAVRHERFLLLTHPHHADALVERARQLARGVLPERGDFT
ncbi:MAG: SDR family NAD(P)-dependent oxidoreductase [Actinobacteria bacterium]|nr:SDR family NAD(P)-dependent oxidoreductase [Actinomycetota bacterium]